MKNAYIIFLSFLFPSLLFAEESSRFPITSASEWKINYTVMHNDDTNREGDEYATYFINSDTTINNIKYFKLYKSGFAYYDITFYFSNVYIGALRNAGNKIFYIEKNKTAEVLLYDFNVVKGDMIDSYIENGMVVSSIDTLPDGRRKINIKKTDYQHGECLNLDKAFFIEGIGSMGGIFYPSPCDHIGYTEHYLVCYKENGELIYQSDLSPENCDSQVLVPAKVNNQSLDIFPVPTKNRVTIEFELPPAGDIYIEIYNIQGIKLLSNRLENSGNNTSINLDLTELNMGIYIIQIFDKLNSFKRKLIIE